MLSCKNHLKVIGLCLALTGLLTALRASYYLDTLFPIGLTGINGTGGNCPYYYAGDGWRWQYEAGKSGSEDSLIFDLGINCIGCQDAKPNYLTPAGLTKIPKSLLSKHNPLRRMK